MSESDSPVLLSHEGTLSVITINRPRALNALNTETLKGILDAAAELAGRAEVRAVIVTGAGGKAFVAGADIAEMVEMQGPQGRALADLGDEAFGALEALPVPVIAAVQGFALGGGCELALACDFIYASTKAKFAQPEVKLGIVPGFGGSQRLPRRVGLGLARELIYTGRMIDAAEALRIGLVNRICEPDQLMDQARATAAEITGNGPLAVASSKSLMLAGHHLALEEAVALEAQAFGALFDSADQKEGMAAFLGKRTAEFKGQ